MADLSLTLKVCARCEQTKSIDNFHLRKDRPAGYQSYCKDCFLERGRGRYKTDPQRFIEANRRWRKDNPERLKEHKRANYVKTRETHTERDRARALKWVKDNPEKSNAARAYKRALAKMATPVWANLFFMEEA